MKKRKTDSSIRKKVFTATLLLIFLQVIIIAGFIIQGGVMKKLNQNALDILKEKVINRSEYLEENMLSRWSNLTVAENKLNEIAQQLKEEKGKSFFQINTTRDIYGPFLSDSVNILIELMRQNGVTGAFIVLNTDSLEENVIKNKKGIYLRDYEPISTPSETNSDILVERMPRSLIQKCGLATDVGWKQQFQFMQNGGYGDYFYEPYYAAEKNPDLTSEELGYWSRGYKIYGDSKEAISYSIPLRLSDGTLYGVLGIEISKEYLGRIMPYAELNDQAAGAYMLGVSEDGTVFYPALATGVAFNRSFSRKDGISVQKSSVYKDTYEIMSKEYPYCSIKYLNLYDRNTPFFDQQWAVIGTVRENALFSFSRSIFMKMLIIVGIIIILGVGISTLIIYMIVRPVQQLAATVEQSKTKRKVILERTGILELDQLEVEIENLSQALLESSRKFSDILMMASVKLAGFEYDKEKGNFFLTDGFWELFQLEGQEEESLESLEQKIKELEHCRWKEEKEEGISLYHITTKTGSRWVRLIQKENDEKIIGLAEDVTKETLELHQVERERDYDVLTGLFNRRAFRKQLGILFEKGEEVLKNAALIMIDLDDLKHVNDNYGHAFGDSYIKKAAQAFLQMTKGNGIAARQSGDEFLIFYYGYDTKDTLKSQIKKLQETLNGLTIKLPDGKEFMVRMSGGIAYYDAKESGVENLLWEADKTMYQSKKSGKNKFMESDKTY